jgi:transposase
VELVQRPPEPAPKDVLMAWAESSGPIERVTVGWERLSSPRGFQILPRRLVVERSFAQVCHNRRVAKDYERGSARRARCLSMQR